MNSASALIPVLSVAHLDPGAGRREMNLPHGLTIAEIVAAALPAAHKDVLAQTRVTLVTPKGMQVILPEHWHRVRPHPNVQVVIRIMPGKDALRSILSIVVSIAAVALAPVLFPTLGTFGLAVASAGLTVLGTLLINALIPPVTPDTDKAASYSITGLQNQAIPNGAVPSVLGTMRFAPPYAALPYTEIVGDDVFIRAFFVLGEGNLQIDDMRLGETSLSEFDEVEIEVRNGVAGDLPVSLYPRQIVEEQIGVELTRPFPRDDMGEIIQVESESDWPEELGPFEGFGGSFNQGDDAPTIETPIVRTTGKDASGATVIFSFPAGLVRFNDDGKKRTHSVTVRLEQRLVEAMEWQEVETLEFSAKKVEGFYRQHSWTFPTRAQWQVRATMMTDETDDSKKQQRTTWAALQTLRPEYPLNYARPLALVALRIKATHQLNGALDNFSMLASRVCLDWDAPTQTWVRRVTQNPASLYRHVLQAAENPKAASDAEINLAQLQDWHEFCDAKGLTYNAALSATTTLLGDILAEICAAGRATRDHGGLQWGIVVDQPTEDALIVDHVSPRNAWSFSGSRSYVSPPDAFVVTFKDADNDYKETQREIPWPGYAGDIEQVEAIAMPGKVHAAEIWREARRRQLEITHRPDTFEATQDGALRVTTRGDHVMVNDYALSLDHVDARVLQIEGNLIVIDELVQMKPDTDYAVRFRHFEDDEDTIGTSVVRLVNRASEDTSVLTLTGPETSTAPVPDLRAVIQIGPATFTAHQRIITGIERTTDACSILRMIDAAPQIDVELEATDVPAWSSRVGAEIDANLLQPSAPRFVSISSGLSGTDTEDLITFLIAPGSGAVSTASFEIDHRLSGGAWITLTLPAGAGGGTIEGYATGDAIELRARGVSLTGVEGPPTGIVTLTVGAGDADIPASLDEASITVNTLLGGALIQIAMGDDAATTALQIYRSTSATLDRETDATGQPLAVEPQSTVSTTLGDTTRENLIAGGAMTNAAAWDLDAGWAVAGGVATHTAGASDAIAQSLAATTGKQYRIGFTVAGATAGTLTPRLTGGSNRPGTSITAGGVYSDRIQAVTGNNTLEFLADADFDGTLDDVTAYLETAGCLSQGTHYIWIEPQNADGLNGAVSGPYAINII
jgi:hypothetical protein